MAPPPLAKAQYRRPLRSILGLLIFIFKIGSHFAKRGE
jgi:hypothetical protein